MVIDGDTIFRRATLENLTFNRMAFKKTVDFEGASVNSKVSFRAVSFDGDLRLEDSAFPTAGQKGKDDADSENREITIRDITLNKGFYIDAEQFLNRAPWWALWREDRPRFFSDDKIADPDGSTSKDDRRIWRELSRAFELAKNLELQNYAEYRLRLSDEASKNGEAKIASVTSRWLWGYGLRPLRPLLWLAVVVLAFAVIYWTQLSMMASERLIRARYALVFSARTAWEFKYGYANSATSVFRLITIIESALAKLILALFAYTLTQTSPLLSEIMKKLLP